MLSGSSPNMASHVSPVARKSWKVIGALVFVRS
jgi:hypothetical protein